MLRVHCATPDLRTATTRSGTGVERLFDKSITVTAAIAEGKRPVTFRTRKLSPPAPMVLHPRECGRVGRRRTHPTPRAAHNRAALDAFPNLCDAFPDCCGGFDWSAAADSTGPRLAARLPRCDRHHGTGSFQHV